MNLQRWIPTRWLRAALLAVLVALGALLPTQIFRHMAPPARGHLVAPRLEALRAEATPPDLLFFGSSHVGWGLVPDVVDRVFAQHGVTARSFNLGSNRMGCHAADALLRRVLADPQLRPRMVLVELCLWESGIAPDEAFTDRTIEWHDATQTRSVLRSVQRSNLPWRTKARHTAQHLLHFLAQRFAAGEAVRVLAERLGDVARPVRRIEAILAERGYHGFDMQRWRSRVPDFEGDYLERVERMRQDITAEGALEHSLRSYSFRALRDQIETIESHGVRAIYLVPAISRRPPIYDLLIESGLVPEAIQLNDPRRYPELYALAERWDDHHLTRAGAERQSRIVAREILALPPETR